MIFELFVTAVGGVLAGSFLYSLIWSRRFLRRAVPGAAVVTDRELHSTRTGSSRRRWYSIEVRFRTREGRTVTSEIDVSGTKAPKPGREVRVLYDPQDPEVARLDTPLGRGTCWKIPATLFGLCFFVGGLIAFVRTLLG